MKEWIYIIIGWNLVTFLLMGTDKFLAIKKMRRISEQTLLMVAFLMGGFGSLLGSILFRHKTRKWKFRLLLPIALLFNLSVLFLIWYYLL